MPTGRALQTNSTTRSNKRNDETSDSSLLEAVAGGDQAALQVLFARYSTQIYRFAARLTGSTTIAEETVSDVFLEVWRGRGSYQGRSQLSAWLLGIARNKALSASRRSTEAQLDEASALFIPDAGDGPEETLLKQDRGSIVDRCLRRLPRVQQQALDLFYLREKPISEVVAIVGVSQSTIKTRMFYGRSRMAELLGEAGIDSART